jgi:hypothetical protein
MEMRWERACIEGADGTERPLYSIEKNRLWNAFIMGEFDEGTNGVFHNVPEPLTSASVAIRSRARTVHVTSWASRPAKSFNTL